MITPLLIVFLSVLVSFAFAKQVTFDSRSLIIDGERKLLMSGSIHYPRSTPSMWPDLIQTAKTAGVNVIETYIFWNIHEPVKGEYNFEFNANIFKFLVLVYEAGLYVNLRVGPYVCAEWNYGGIPVWLRDIEGIEMRADNLPFENEVTIWVNKIIGMIKEKNLFYPNGPIILSQIENEYDGPAGGYDREKATRYVEFNANLARSQETGTPWIMCQQDLINPGEDIIVTCNGFFCDNWIETTHAQNHPNQPAFFSEVREIFSFFFKFV